MKKKYFAVYGGLPREIYILFAARVTNCMGSFILPLLTLILTQKLGMSKEQTGAFSSFLILTQAPSLILGGKLTDTIGRKKLLVSCELLGAFFYLLCGILGNNSYMIAFIVLASNLLVASSPAFEAMVADITPPEKRRISFSFLYLGVNIGMTVSPILGGLLFQRHLPLLFILDAATTAACAIMIAKMIPEPDFRQKKDSASTEQTAPEKRVSVFLLLKSAPVLTGFIFLLFFYDFVYSQWSFMLPVQFGDLYGDSSAKLYSVLSAANSFVVISCTPLITHLTRKFRPLPVIAGGGMLYFTAFLIFGRAEQFPLFLAAGILFTFGEIAVTINLGSFIANHTPGVYRGRISSFSMFVRGTASSLGPLIMGRAITRAGYFACWSVIAAVILTGATGVFLLDKKERRSALSVAPRQAEACVGKIPEKPDL